MIVGPGRWGTSTPSLGVPVRFAEICNVVAIAEVASPIGGFLPDLSFGSHFFQDLVETDIFYVALFPGQSGSFINRELIDTLPNRLTAVLPGEEGYAPVVRVLDFAENKLELLVDIVAQEAVCFLRF
jgi:hypothetical protein